MRNLQDIYWNCIYLMDEIGMDYGTITKVEVNTRAKRRWGQCKSTFVGRNAIGERVYTYTINISSILLDDKTPIEALQNTIIHEILHTCPGCLNHGIEWKRRAEKVKEKLGYDIKRCSDADEKGVSERIINVYRKPKYIVKCQKCGREVGRYKMCSIIQYPQHWRCGVCNGEFKRIV